MIVLEPLELRHAPLILQAARESVAEVSPWMPWCTPELGIDDIETWVADRARARTDGSAFEMAIMSPTGHYLGGGGINCVRQDHNFANVGYWVRTAATRQGIATETLRQLVAWSRSNSAINRLEVVVAVGNIASQRVAEKAGGQRECIARSRLLLHGRYHDAVIYSFIRV